MFQPASFVLFTDDDCLNESFKQNTAVHDRAPSSHDHHLPQEPACREKNTRDARFGPRASGAENAKALRPGNQNLAKLPERRILSDLETAVSHNVYATRSRSQLQGTVSKRVTDSNQTMELKENTGNLKENVDNLQVAASRQKAKPAQPSRPVINEAVKRSNSDRDQQSTVPAKRGLRVASNTASLAAVDHDNDKTTAKETSCPSIAAVPCSKSTLESVEAPAIAVRQTMDERFHFGCHAEQIYAHLRLVERRQLDERAHFAGLRQPQLSLSSSAITGWSPIASTDLLRLQTDVTNVHRLILVDWLVDVCSEFALSGDTLHLAIQLVDRYLLRAHIARAHFQLIGAAALYLAAKFEEISPPDCTELAHITADAFTGDQIRKSEALLFRSLDFRMHGVTARCFADHFLCTLGLRDWNFDSFLEGDCEALPNGQRKRNTRQFRVRTLVAFLLELAVFDASRFAHYTDSLIATAAVYIAIHSVYKPANHSQSHSDATLSAYREELHRIAEYGDRCTALAACIREMHFVARSHRQLYAASHSLDAIARKYSRVELACVASLPIAPLEWLPIVAAASRSASSS